MLLRKHTSFEVNSRDALDTFLRAMAAGSVRTAQPNDQNVAFKCNAALTDLMPMFSLSSDFSATFDFEPSEDIRLVFHTGAASQVCIGGHARDIKAFRGSYLLPAAETVAEHYPNGFKSFAVRISPSDITRKLEALTGEPQPTVTFSQPNSSDGHFLRFVRRSLLTAAQELDAVDPMFHRTLIEEIKAVTLTRLLLFVPHSASQTLTGRPKAPSRAQMRLAEDYLAASWDRPLDMKGLADAVGVSARTVLRYFHEYYGKTPREYVKSMRLDRTRAMLQLGDDATVTDIALRCGFTSLGKFADVYYRQFGELPSDTRRRCN